MRISQFDLVVVGATPGGIACAVRAAREGLSVLLTNWNAHLNHMMGYFYFIQNDEAFPKETRERNRRYGLDRTLYP